MWCGVVCEWVVQRKSAQNRKGETERKEKEKEVEDNEKQKAESENAERKKALKEHRANFVTNKEGTTKQKNDHCAPLSIPCSHRQTDHKSTLKDSPLSSSP